MKPLIDKHNYEAYYLDYIEGNLDAETSVLLEAFLAAHPELVVDADFPVVMPEEHIDESFKMSLKHEATGAVAPENIEYFLIAELESQLTQKQLAELEEFLLQNPQFEEDRKLLRSTIMVPENAVYEHKELLKKTARIIPLWVKMAAAAVVVLLFSIPFIRFSSSPLVIPPQTAAVDSLPGEPAQTAPVQNAQADRTQTGQAGVSASRVNYSNNEPVVAKQDREKTSNLPRPRPHTREIHVGDLPVKHIRSTAPELAIASEPVQQTAVSVDEVHESKMENPIPVITRGVSEVFNTPVDVKTEKSSNKRGKGFYVRIGNVEVSRSASL